MSSFFTWALINIDALHARKTVVQYISFTFSARGDGIPKYKKGYEQHMAPESGLGNTPHIKWYNRNSDGHIFYDTPN